MDQIKLRFTAGRIEIVGGLPMVVVPFIKVQGNRLIEMDLSNAGPFFMCCLLDPTTVVSQIMVRTLGRTVVNEIKAMRSLQFDDGQLFRSLVTSGRFYEHMQSVFPKSGIQYSDRTEAKNHTIEILFVKGLPHNSREVQAIKQEFPNVYSATEIINRGDHHRLADTIDQVQSHVIGDYIAPRLRRELPQLKIYTRYDAVLLGVTPVSNGRFIDRAGAVITEEMQRVTGLTPQGRVKYVS